MYNAAQTRNLGFIFGDTNLKSTTLNTTRYIDHKSQQVKLTNHTVDILFALVLFSPLPSLSTLTVVRVAAMSLSCFM